MGSTPLDPPAAAPNPLQTKLDAANAQIASLQKQLTHVTAEMIVYRNATIQHDAEYLGFYALDLQQQVVIAAYRSGKAC